MTTNDQQQPTAPASDARLSAWVTTPKRMTGDELAEIQEAFIDSPEGKSLMRDGVRGLLAEIDHLRASVAELTDERDCLADWRAVGKNLEAEVLKARADLAASRAAAARLREALDEIIALAGDRTASDSVVACLVGAIAREALAAAATPPAPGPDTAPCGCPRKLARMIWHTRDCTLERHSFYFPLPDDMLDEPAPDEGAGSGDQ